MLCIRKLQGFHQPAHTVQSVGPTITFQFSCLLVGASFPSFLIARVRATDRAPCEHLSLTVIERNERVALDAGEWERCTASSRSYETVACHWHHYSREVAGLVFRQVVVRLVNSNNG